VNPEWALYDPSNDANLKELQETLKVTEVPIRLSGLEQSTDAESSFSPRSASDPVEVSSANGKPAEYPLVTVCKMVNEYTLMRHIALAARTSSFCFDNQALAFGECFALCGKKGNNQIQKFQEYHKKYINAVVEVFI
jgi:hypothetical protein